MFGGEFTPEQERRILGLLDARLKTTRHTNADHLERALLVSKLKPKGVAGGLLVDTGTDVEWLDPAPGDGYSISSVSSATGGSEWIPGQFATIDANTGRGGGTTAGFYLNRIGGIDAFSTAGVLRALLYIDPEDGGSGSLTPKVKLRAWALTETDPTDSTLTVDLLRITAVSGGAIAGAGGAVATATMTPNAANTMYQGESTEATISDAGWYGVRFTHSVAPAQNMTYGYRLETRLA